EAFTVADPNFTCATPVKFLPTIFTLVPPPGAPTAGVTLLISGPKLYMAASLMGVDPTFVVTWTFTALGLVPCAGALTVRLVPVLLTVTILPARAPNFTLVAPWRLAPLIVTVLPPAAGPYEGEMPVTTGPY